MTWEYWVVYASWESGKKVKIDERDQKVTNYILEVSDHEPLVGLNSICNYAGSMGWELVSTEAVSPFMGGWAMNIALFFKRPKAA